MLKHIKDVHCDSPQYAMLSLVIVNKNGTKNIKKEMNNLKTIKKFILSALFIFLICTMTTCLVNAEGVSGSIRSTSAYDLDRDGKNDTLTLNTSAQRKGSLYINGKKVYDIPTTDGGKGDEFSCYVITLENGNNFIFVQSVNDPYTLYHTRDIILQYTKNKNIKIIFDFQKNINKYVQTAYVPAGATNKTAITVTGNRVEFIFTGVFFSISGADISVPFIEKNGTLVRASVYGNLIDSTYSEFTALKDIQTYVKPGSKHKAMVIKKGTKTSVHKYYLKGDNLWMLFKNSSGEEGWIKCLTKTIISSAGRSQLFREVFLAT